jgi:hypothetical protein
LLTDIIVELSFSPKNQQMKPALCLKAADICEVRHATKKFRVGVQIPMTSETPCGVTWQAECGCGIWIVANRR